MQKGLGKIGFFGVFVDCNHSPVYDITMKKNSLRLITILFLLAALTLVAVFAPDSCQGQVAQASSVETFVFDSVKVGDTYKFSVKVKSTGEEIYLANFDEVAVLDAIKSVVGENAYDVELTAPTVALDTDTEMVQPYSPDNLFMFSASATHDFARLGIMGYRGADPSNGYEWHFSREGAVETKFGGVGAKMPFGASRAYGEYEIFAYATISLTFNGVTYTATGKSSALGVEIEKSSANLPDIQEESLAFEQAYGKTIEEILDDTNVQSRDFAFVLPDDSDGTVVLGAGVHGVDVEYVVGSWNGGVFEKDESVNGVRLSVAITVKPYDVHILLHNVIVKQGEEVKLTYEMLAPSKLPNNESVSDLKLNIFADGDTSQSGQYTIKGESGNPNYRVIFSNYDNRDNSDYSTWATLTIRPAYITAEHEGVKVTLFRNDGFQYGDEIVFADCIGDNVAEGAKTIRVYNNNEEITYTDLTVTIEKIDQIVGFVTVNIGGEVKDFAFDEEGKITFDYSTEKAVEFQLVVVKVDPADSLALSDNEVIGIALLVGFLLVFGCFYSYVSRKKKYPKDIYVRETRDEKPTLDIDATTDTENNGTAQNGSLSDENDTLKDESGEKAPKKVKLTLEEKLALHPEFVPTPSLKEVFKEKDADDVDDDTSLDESVDESAEDTKITFKSKMISASVENKAIYNALKNQILSYRGVKSRVVNGGDYFRRPGKQIVKIIFIGKTIRLALALDPKDYDYNLYHQKDRGGMKKYADTPMFVKVQSPLGVRRAFTLISDLMAKEGLRYNKKYSPDDYLYDLTYGESTEENND